MPALKLLAFDPDDIAIVSANLQDAVLTVADMTYDAKERRFVALFNRLDRQPEDQRAGLVRRRAALRIERVTRAEVQGLDLKDKSQVLALLTLDTRAVEPPAGTITLVFSGTAAIRLHVECVEASLSDLGPAWATSNTPVHDIDAVNGPKTKD